MSAGSSTDTKTERKRKTGDKNDICRVQDFRCLVSCVIYHLSLVTNAKSHSHRPSSANSRIMLSRLICKELKTENFFKLIFLLKETKTKKTYKADFSQRFFFYLLSTLI